MQKSKNSLVEPLLEKCLRFISLRPRSSGEVARRLERYAQTLQATEDEQNTVIERLKEMDLINDVRFIEWWVEQRSYFRPRGKAVLTAELRQKGIETSAINEYFQSNPIDELPLAREIILKKFRSLRIKKGSDRRKMGERLLQRRGFSWDVIKKVFEETDDLE